MPVSYNDIVGEQIARLANLSDSIFGVGMTLLILEIRLPSGFIATDRQLWDGLLALGPRFLVYFMSFLTLGIFWNAQQVQLSSFDHGDRHLTWIHIAFLATVAITPFSTALLENFIHLRTALAIFWLNLLLLGSMLYASWRYASANGLLRNDVSLETKSAVERRILLAQALYAAGFALCVFSTLWSIAAIALIQFGLALAPTIWWFKRRTLFGHQDHHRSSEN
jgi:uncharacterized membrane protein